MRFVAERKLQFLNSALDVVEGQIALENIVLGYEDDVGFRQSVEVLFLLRQNLSIERMEQGNASVASRRLRLARVCLRASGVWVCLHFLIMLHATDASTCGRRRIPCGKCQRSVKAIRSRPGPASTSPRMGKPRGNRQRSVKAIRSRRPVCKHPPAELPGL